MTDLAEHGAELPCVEAQRTSLYLVSAPGKWTLRKALGRCGGFLAEC